MMRREGVVGVVRREGVDVDGGEGRGWCEW